ATCHCFGINTNWISQNFHLILTRPYLPLLPGPFFPAPRYTTMIFTTSVSKKEWRISVSFINGWMKNQNWKFTTPIPDMIFQPRSGGSRTNFWIGNWIIPPDLTLLNNHFQILFQWIL